MSLSDNTDSPEHLCRWPESFSVPTFSYEVAFTLREGNSVFEREGKGLRLTRDQKHNILNVMAAEINQHKAYPSGSQISKAAEALVTKHPCLKEQSSSSPITIWVKPRTCWKDRGSVWWRSWGRALLKETCFSSRTKLLNWGTIQARTLLWSPGK